MDRLTTARLDGAVVPGMWHRRRGAVSSPTVQLSATSLPYDPAVQRADLESPPTDGSPSAHVDPVDADPIVTERERLEAQIAAARRRTAAAVDRTRRREADLRAALRVEIEATRAALADLERRHRAALDLVHEATELEIERLRVAAPTDDRRTDHTDGR